MSTKVARIGFVGAGHLGRPMVERLAAAGHDVVAHARRPEARAELELLGVRVTDDLATVAAGRDLVLLCVFTDEQVAEVAAPVAAAMSEGAVLASHVTGRTSTLKAVAAAAPHIHVVEAPLSGTAPDIRAGRLTVLLGGAPSARAVVATAISAYASNVFEAGELGTALPTKLVNNLLFAANVQCLADAIRLGGELGVPQETLLAILQHMSGASQASRHASHDPTLDAFAQRLAPFLIKDVAVCHELAAELGVDPGMLADIVNRGPLALT